MNKGGNDVKNVIRIGDKLDLVQVEKEEGEKKKQYTSQFLDFIEDDKAKIAMPMENLRVIPLAVGDKYAMSFHTVSGLFQCQCEIVDRYKEGNVYILVVQFTSALERCQRRQFYRLESIIDSRYRVFSDEEEKLLIKLKNNAFTSEAVRNACEKALEKVQDSWQDATITNISGGGVRFNSKQELPKEGKIYMNIPLQLNGEDLLMELKARIVATAPVFNRTGLYETRVEFVEIPLDDREDIVKYVFEQERRKIKKGMI